MPIIENKKLADPIQLATASTTFYTVPGGASTIISTLSVANATGSAVSFSIHLCVGDSTPDDSNVLLPNVSLDGNSIANFNFGQVIHEYDTIKAYASIPNVLTLHGSGIQIT